MRAPIWRLLLDGAGDGDWNMALDRAIQLEHAEGRTLPTVRFYRWKQPTVTLGRFQYCADVNWDACERFGVKVVRRSTGGRGVLHDDELTYSIVAGTRDGIPRGVAASYRHLTAALIATYRALGVDAELFSRSPRPSRSAACYLQATPADICVGPLKLSGSAQSWDATTVLQHGSFVRTRDLGREIDVFGLSGEDADLLGAVTVTLADLIDEAPSLDLIQSAAIAGFASGLNVRLQTSVLGRSELTTARNLLEATRAQRA